MPKLISNIRKLAYNTLRGKTKGTDAYELACFAALVTLSIDEQHTLALIVEKGPVPVDNNPFVRSLIDCGLAVEIYTNENTRSVAATPTGFDVLDHDIMYNGKYADPFIAKD